MSELMLEVHGLKKQFEKKKGKIQQAVNGVSFQVAHGENVGLVGGSGCGKSTVARLITRLERADEGEIVLNGKVQMIFQSPVDSFDPRRTLGDGIMEGMIHSGARQKDARERAEGLLILCGLPKDYMERYPHQVSGGECQRAAIARALMQEPELLICDEATSALDVTVQAQIVGLLKRLQQKNGMALLFISHDLALVQELCDRIMVMHDGEIVESGTTDEVIMEPKSLYARRMINAM